jgi:hypothetical protein
MEHTVTANQLRGRAIGSIFFAVFGALWITIALYVRQILTVDLTIGVAAVLAALLLSAVWLLRQAKLFPKLPENRAVSREFNRINAIQWIAVGIVAFSFARLHIDAYVLSAITAIVGIHMFPLAKLFRYPLHNVTGAVLVAWASASVLLFPIESLQGATAIGTGIILWLSAATTLAIAAKFALRPRLSQHANQNSLCS